MRGTTLRRDVISALVVENAKVARDDLVLKYSTGWDVDSFAVIRYDDHRPLHSTVDSGENTDYLVFTNVTPFDYAKIVLLCWIINLGLVYLEGDILAERDVTRHRQMI